MDANFQYGIADQFVGPAKTGVLPATTGKYIYVHASGSATSVGLNSKIPVITTIDTAIGKCRAGKGDIVVVMPGHTETITTAAAIDIDVAGATVLGLGSGNNRPVITISSTDNTGSIKLSANNTRLLNVVVVGNDDALTNAILVTGNNCIIDVETQDTSSTVEMATAVRLDTADNVYLRLKHLGFTAGDAMTACVILDDTDNARIEIDAYGVVSTSWVNMQDVASTNVYVTGRTYTQGVTNGARNVVDTITGSTWYMSVDDMSAGAKFTGGSASAVASDDVSSIAANQTSPSADSTSNTLSRDVVGNKTDAVVYTPSSTKSLAGYAKGTADLQEKVAKKSAATLTNGQTLFTVSGGPIQIIGLISICETGNDATASTLQYNSVPTSGSAQTISGASASLANATAGASVTLAGTALSTAALYNANGANLIANPGTIVVPAGTITAVVAVGSTTGTWAHYLRYRPLSASVVVS